jgi:hypothetical protein
MPSRRQANPYFCVKCPCPNGGDRISCGQ